MKAPHSGAAAGAASLLFMLVSPFFSPTTTTTTTSAFTAAPSLFGGAETRRHASSPLSSSSFYASPRSPSSSSPPRNRWAPSSSAVRAGGDDDDDGFSFGDLQRELSRRRAEEAMTPDTEQQQQEQQQQQQQQQQQGSLQGAEDREAFMEEQMSLRKMLLKAFVLVYNQGQPEEGVYTLFVEGRNVLRAWEDRPEAARYALMLRAEDLPLGKPTELPMTQIISFCKENGVGLELIPLGRGLQPPSRNKPEFDFDCSPEEGRGKGPPGAAAPSPASPGDESLFTPQELARIKSQFEKSLESDEEA